MSMFHQHNHEKKKKLHPIDSRTAYAEVVGTVNKSSEHPITGRSGEHLQFTVSINHNTTVQVDVNIQSRDGSDVMVYTADEEMEGDTANHPFSSPAFGIFPNASLSYALIGLTDDNFRALNADRLLRLLEATLNQSVFVAIYGQTFNDGGPNGRGVHETHFNRNAQNQDGAVSVALEVNGKPVRRWFFFKFEKDHIQQK